MKDESIGGESNKSEKEGRQKWHIDRGGKIEKGKDKRRAVDLRGNRVV